MDAPHWLPRAWQPLLAAGLVLIAATGLAAYADPWPVAVPAPATPRAGPTDPGMAKAPYTGPVDAAGVMLACAPQRGPSAVPCYTDRLEQLLAAKGAEAAFTALEELARLDAGLDPVSHPLAHDLGYYALDVYGTIQAAMQNCSYKVFQGCFHGALQSHFGRLPRIGPEDLKDLCPIDNLFRQYTCLHGVGHGLMLASANNFTWSLALCDVLPTSFGRESCYGGAFMENVIAYFDSRTPGGGHTHGDGPPPVYHVDAADPRVPCSQVPSHTQPTCWLMQTSLVLYFNGGDFRTTMRVCGGLDASLQPTCFKSVGRDAADYTHHDTPGGVERCSYAPSEMGRAQCIRGFTADFVLNWATPDAAIPVCKAVPEQDKAPCWEELAVQGRTMVSPVRMAAICQEAELMYQKDCRRGAGIG